MREGIERRLFTSGELLGTHVRWCEEFPLCHLVNGVMVIRVEGIWSKEIRCRIQAQRWWHEIQWGDRGRELYPLCWKADWILIEESQVPKYEN